MGMKKDFYRALRNCESYTFGIKFPEDRGDPKDLSPGRIYGEGFRDGARLMCEKAIEIHGKYILLSGWQSLAVFAACFFMGYIFAKI